MNGEKFAIRVLLRHYWKKAIWFKRFDEGETSLEDKPRSGRPTILNEQALREKLESTCKYSRII